MQKIQLKKEVGKNSIWLNLDLCLKLNVLLIMLSRLIYLAMT